MKITKLDGIEQMLNLTCISLAKNKLTSIKKLKHLKNLQFLDLRNNNISHFDEPPEMLTEINLSDNQFIGLMFCGRLQLLTKLNVNNNKIKSLKGLESCKLLEVLQAADNNLKEKNELEILNAFPKLMVLDLTNNPISDSDDYRKKVLQKCSALLVIDCEIVPKDERSMILRKQGKIQ
uniref:Uncharacterized protein n=1 Tax=Panagrolaimus davidi TaxID=227884 RepID=A0A914Q109_9BILA